MSEGQRMPITLAIGDHKTNLPVITVSGREALNAPYRFVIDVLSTDPNLQLKALEQTAAYLALGPDQGVHGKISSAVQLHAGIKTSLYRVTLGPALLDLEQRRQRRVFRELSVPHIITRLLEEHRIDKSTWRFEQLMGIYPPREVCVQHDETDLELLLRLCEEEGIHLRFEHQHFCHLMIFADDPACFPHRSVAAQFKPPVLQAVYAPAISYLAEQWALQPVTPDHNVFSHHHRALPSPKLARGNERDASNQRLEASVLSRLPTERQAHERQIGARVLERQRCERRTILGLSTDLPMTPGQIIQVQAHPEARFNDQWLMVEVTHFASQPQLLPSRATEDAAQIIEVIKSLAARSEPELKDFNAESYRDGYSNSFRVLPWEMPFRPALKHRKPAAGVQTATLLSQCKQTKDQRLDGRLPIGFDPDSAQASAELYAHACISLPQLKALRIGATLNVGHFESDPQRPIILGVPDEHGASSPSQPMDSLPSAEQVHLDLPQTLHLSAGRELQLATVDARFRLTATRISMTGAPPLLVAKDRSMTMDAHRQHAALTFLDADLRLTEQPGLRGAPLAHCLWYIVRMRDAGLQFLARLQPEHFLFEGKTDKHGYCGLGPQQLRELADAYRKSPDDLCLVHPGKCIKLQTWFEQNWPKRLHQAFRQHR